VLLLALFGALQIALGVAGHFGGSSATASLPQCSIARVRQNIVRATTIQSEANTALYRRIDDNNALLLSSGGVCSDSLFAAYSEFIEYQTLCLEFPSSTACQSRDAAHTRALQEAGSQ
jgi:hypothetical protein